MANTERAVYKSWHLGNTRILPLLARFSSRWRPVSLLLLASLSIKSRVDNSSPYFLSPSAIQSPQHRSGFGQCPSTYHPLLHHTRRYSNPVVLLLVVSQTLLDHCHGGLHPHLVHFPHLHHFRISQNAKTGSVRHALHRVLVLLLALRYSMAEMARDGAVRQGL